MASFSQSLSIIDSMLVQHLPSWVQIVDCRDKTPEKDAFVKMIKGLCSKLIVDVPILPEWSSSATTDIEIAFFEARVIVSHLISYFFKTQKVEDVLGGGRIVSILLCSNNPEELCKFVDHDLLKRSLAMDWVIEQKQVQENTFICKILVISNWICTYLGQPYQQKIYEIWKDHLSSWLEKEYDDDCFGRFVSFLWLISHESLADSSPLLSRCHGLFEIVKKNIVQFMKINLRSSCCFLKLFFDFLFALCFDDEHTLSVVDWVKKWVSSKPEGWISSFMHSSYSHSSNFRNSLNRLMKKFRECSSPILLSSLRQSLTFSDKFEEFFDLTGKASSNEVLGNLYRQHRKHFVDFFDNTMKMSDVHGNKEMIFKCVRCLRSHISNDEEVILPYENCIDMFTTFFPYFDRIEKVLDSYKFRALIISIFKDLSNLQHYELSEMIGAKIFVGDKCLMRNILEKDISVDEGEYHYFIDVLLLSMKLGRIQANIPRISAVWKDHIVQWFRKPWYSFCLGYFILFLDVLFGSSQTDEDDLGPSYLSVSINSLNWELPRKYSIFSFDRDTLFELVGDVVRKIIDYQKVTDPLAWFQDMKISRFLSFLAKMCWDEEHTKEVYSHVKDYIFLWYEHINVAKNESIVGWYFDLIFKFFSCPGIIGLNEKLLFDPGLIEKICDSIESEKEYFKYIFKYFDALFEILNHETEDQVLQNEMIIIRCLKCLKFMLRPNSHDVTLDISGIRFHKIRFFPRINKVANFLTKGSSNPWITQFSMLYSKHICISAKLLKCTKEEEFKQMCQVIELIFAKGIDKLSTDELYSILVTTEKVLEEYPLKTSRVFIRYEPYIKLLFENTDPRIFFFFFRILYRFSCGTSKMGKLSRCRVLEKMIKFQDIKLLEIQKRKSLENMLMLDLLRNTDKHFCRSYQALCSYISNMLDSVEYSYNLFHDIQPFMDYLHSIVTQHTPLCISDKNNAGKRIMCMDLRKFINIGQSWLLLLKDFAKFPVLSGKIEEKYGKMMEKASIGFKYSEKDHAEFEKDVEINNDRKKGMDEDVLRIIEQNPSIFPMDSAIEEKVYGRKESQCEDEEEDQKKRISRDLFSIMEQNSFVNSLDSANEEKVYGRMESQCEDEEEKSENSTPEDSSIKRHFKGRNEDFENIVESSSTYTYTHSSCISRGPISDSATRQESDRPEIFESKDDDCDSDDEKKSRRIYEEIRRERDDDRTKSYTDMVSSIIQESHHHHLSTIQAETPNLSRTNSSENSDSGSSSSISGYVQETHEQTDSEVEETMETEMESSVLQTEREISDFNHE
ncbi:hypothetical protein ADUPG1_012441 [Aduncisulcus paluster]|uniref:Uncharacterized protein n=1 Tax=Aduncisulcus paluster TaxID=2918883 RepID=A0ABQ5K360_9EUKA|nr:hypothetical protein ADUPG1_012441 [Aduncisulcus paluster]